MATTPSTSRTPALGIIERLESALKSKVIVYITGDRLLKSAMPLPPEANLTTKVATDVLPLFDDILRDFGTTQKITLILYTNGGLIEAPWPIVNQLRDYCEELEVIVLKKALSAGTLIALGADKIVMPRGSYLSPIDPAATVTKDKKVKNIEIENIIGYIDFAKDKVGINDQQTLGEVLKELSKEIDPSLIGSINRTHSLIRKLSKKLLELHGKKLPEHQLKELVEQLTEKLFAHTHLISRREAQEIGFGDLVVEPSVAVNKLIDELYDNYTAKMKLRKPLVIERMASELSKANKTDQNEKCITAVVHSAKVKYNLESEVRVKLSDSDKGKQINVSFINPAEWVKEG